LQKLLVLSLRRTFRRVAEKNRLAACAPERKSFALIGVIRGQVSSSMFGVPRPAKLEHARPQRIVRMIDE
jgi:hypothetical protein